ncbi:hypothetical protein M8J76_013109 [Diaphorina citri]|nr:hypothetical protein M8J76_013109 [Diaphorina citri]
MYNRTRRLIKPSPPGLSARRVSSAMPDGSPTSVTDLNNNGGSTKCSNTACYGSSSSSINTASTNHSSSGMTTPPRRVQVTAKILFGSVSAITTMKHNEKLQRKRSQ